MTSLAVRQLFETWLTDPAMTVPFHPTINQEQDPAEAIWCTATFGSSFREALTFCNGLVREEGEVEVIYFGPPGEGYTALLTAIEADMATLMAQRDPANRLVLTGRSAPYEFSGGDADLEYSASVYVEYSLYT